VACKKRVKPHKRHNFRKKKGFGLNTCVWFTLQSLSETFLIFKIFQLDAVINVYTSSRKTPVVLQGTLNFLDGVSKILQNFMKIC
jgi:hypothetical protein